MAKSRESRSRFRAETRRVSGLRTTTRRTVRVSAAAAPAGLAVVLASALDELGFGTRCGWRRLRGVRAGRGRVQAEVGIALHARTRAHVKLLVFECVPSTGDPSWRKFGVATAQPLKGVPPLLARDAPGALLAHRFGSNERNPPAAVQSAATNRELPCKLQRFATRSAARHIAPRLFQHIVEHQALGCPSAHNSEWSRADLASCLAGPSCWGRSAALARSAATRTRGAVLGGRARASSARGLPPPRSPPQPGLAQPEGDHAREGAARSPAGPPCTLVGICGCGGRPHACRENCLGAGNCPLPAPQATANAHGPDDASRHSGRVHSVLLWVHGPRCRVAVRQRVADETASGSRVAASSQQLHLCAATAGRDGRRFRLPPPGTPTSGCKHQFLPGHARGVFPPRR